jgi:ribosome-associated protein
MSAPRRPTVEGHEIVGGKLDAYERAVVAARAAADKKAEQIVVLDVGDVIGITDAFVIATGNNERQVRTICDEVELAVEVEAGVKPRSVEGIHDASWVLLDYGDMVVHVFRRETREFYDLERLWTDAPRVAWEPSATAAL